MLMPEIASCAPTNPITYYSILVRFTVATSWAAMRSRNFAA